MTGFIDAVVAYPTAIYTALLGVVVFYWLLALVGLVDFEAGGFDADVQADASVDDLGALGSFIVALGLAGVPFSFIVSLTLIVGWTLSCLAGMWLLPLVPTALLQAAAGTAVLIGSLGVALLITAQALRPFKRLFVTHKAVSSAALVGQACRVTTTRVDESFGYAEVQRRGAGLNVRVWARTPNSLVQGSMARIAEYDEAQGRYRIEPDR